MGYLTRLIAGLVGGVLYALGIAAETACVKSLSEGGTNSAVGLGALGVFLIAIGLHLMLRGWHRHDLRNNPATEKQKKYARDLSDLITAATGADEDDDEG